jgi:hypothetical protein
MSSNFYLLGFRKKFEKNDIPSQEGMYLTSELLVAKVLCQEKMQQIEKLFAELEERYREKTKKSLEIYHKAEKVMVRGGSHTLRIWYTYPLIISKAKGPLVFDIEGNSYIDYWQGHYG